MRKRTSFLAPRFTVSFSHGKDSHTFKVLRISSADGKQMSPSHAQCAFSDATAWKCGCQFWNATPHMLYPTWTLNAHMSSMRVDFEIFFLALRRPTQGWRQTRIHHGLYRSEHSQNQPLACKQMFSLFWSWRGGCPVSLAVLLEYKFLVSREGMQWALYQQLLNFLLGVKLPVKEGKSAELIDNAQLSIGLTIPKAGIFMLRLSGSIESSQASLRP